VTSESSSLKGLSSGLGGRSGLIGRPEADDGDSGSSSDDDARGPYLAALSGGHLATCWPFSWTVEATS
jgi:hypothetical protein